MKDFVIRHLNPRRWLRDARLFCRILSRELGRQDPPLPSSDVAVALVLLVLCWPVGMWYYYRRKEELRKQATPDHD